MILLQIFLLDSKRGHDCEDENITDIYGPDSKTVFLYLQKQHFLHSVLKQHQDKTTESAVKLIFFL